MQFTVSEFCSTAPWDSHAKGQMLITSSYDGGRYCLGRVVSLADVAADKIYILTCLVWDALTIPPICSSPAWASCVGESSAYDKKSRHKMHWLTTARYTGCWMIRVSIFMKIHADVGKLFSFCSCGLTVTVWVIWDSTFLLLRIIISWLCNHNHVHLLCITFS